MAVRTFVRSLVCSLERRISTDKRGRSILKSEFLRGRRIRVDGEQAGTENKSGPRISMDREQVRTENKRGQRISVDGE